MLQFYNGLKKNKRQEGAIVRTEITPGEIIANKSLKPSKFISKCLKK
jgi:hypothetical protein